MDKRVTIVRDFKSESEQKLKYDEQADELHAKRDDNKYNECEKDKSNLKRKVHKHSFAKQQLNAQCYGILGGFKNGYLRIIQSDKEFVSDEIMEEEEKC